MTFRITKELGGSDFGAFFASCLITFDMLNSTESRLVLMDAQLMFWVASGIYMGILLYKRWNAHTGPWSEMIPQLLLTGFVCGCAISIKW
ncbi:MAG: phospholipid carrier-dependent glycosyltransferase [bacterium]